MTTAEANAIIDDLLAIAERHEGSNGQYAVLALLMAWGATQVAALPEEVRSAVTTHTLGLIDAMREHRERMN